jgi:hypothetical protein
MIEVRAHRVREAQAFIDLLMTDAAHPVVALEDLDIPELFDTRSTVPGSAPMTLLPVPFRRGPRRALLKRGGMGSSRSVEPRALQSRPCFGSVV